MLRSLSNTLLLLGTVNSVLSFGQNKNLKILENNNNGNNNNHVDEGRKLLRLPGDIILGGIFPMHEQIAGTSDESPCGQVKEEKGMQRLEAMLFAIDEINNDPNILPNITLGALIIDSCSSDTYALEQSMEFVRSYMNQDMSEYLCESGKPPVYVPHKPVTAVIGASFSVVSIMIANILRLFKIPQISYASTSTELSDKTRFEYFSRVVPPDNFQAQAIGSIIRELGWKYVSTVAVEGEYGEKGIASFISYSIQFGICIAASEKILRNSRIEDFDRVIERLMMRPQAKAVVLFVDEDNTRKLLHATLRANNSGHFLWIGSDAWGQKVHPVRDQEWAAEGAITILPHRNTIQEFDDYYRSLRPQLHLGPCNGTNIPMTEEGQQHYVVNCRNGWFREFWSQHNKCTFDDNGTYEANGENMNHGELNDDSTDDEEDVKGQRGAGYHQFGGWSPGPKWPRCTGRENISEYEQEGLVPFVVDAVYAAALAVDHLVRDECFAEATLDQCEQLKPAPPGAQVLKYIRNVTFTGRQGTDVRFNSDGDAFGSYNIYQYQRKPDGKYDYVQIGSWKETLRLNKDKLQWKDANDIPKSICSDLCPSGHIRNYQDQCCWSCVACREDSYVFNDSCKPCFPGFAPNVNKTDCVKLKALVIDWLNPWALVPLIFSGFGIFCALFTACVFVRYNRTPVIMASGRELCYVLLSGILCCYGMSFIILARPTVETCAVMRVGLGLCLSICYSAIFTKTNRISRIFNRGVKTIKRPVYTSPVSQIAIALGIVSIQLIGAIVWLVIDRPDIGEIYPYPLTAVLTCRVSTFALVMSLVYNMILIILCTWYAFKTRKIPENFNEAKYIGFTMYSTCIVWLAFLPIYFGTNNDYKIQIVSMCMCLNISASVALGCLFTPKVYLVLFQPYKNVRQVNNGNQGATAERPAYSMRFTGPRSQTVQSMTSNSRSSPTRCGAAGGTSLKHLNNGAGGSALHSSTPGPSGVGTSSAGDDAITAMPSPSIEESSLTN